MLTNRIGLLGFGLLGVIAICVINGCDSGSTVVEGSPEQVAEWAEAMKAEEELSALERAERDSQ